MPGERKPIAEMVRKPDLTLDGMYEAVRSAADISRQLAEDEDSSGVEAAVDTAMYMLLASLSQ